MIKVYLASPYTIGNKEDNVKVQMDMFNELVNLGYNVFVPLLSHFLEKNNPRNYEDWMKYDFDWIESCDVVFRIPSDIPSSDADREEEHAQKVGIPVVYSIKELVENFNVN